MWPALGQTTIKFSQLLKTNYMAFFYISIFLNYFFEGAISKIISLITKVRCNLKNPGLLLNYLKSQKLINIPQILGLPIFETESITVRHKLEHLCKKSQKSHVFFTRKESICFVFFIYNFLYSIFCLMLKLVVWCCTARASLISTKKCRLRWLAALN